MFEVGDMAGVFNDVEFRVWKFRHEIFDVIVGNGLVAAAPEKLDGDASACDSSVLIHGAHIGQVADGGEDGAGETLVLELLAVALLPVGGTYTMNAEEAAEATSHIQPKLAIPYHWGDIVGGRSDAEKFSKQAKCNVKILSPGETVIIEE